MYPAPERKPLIRICNGATWVTGSGQDLQQDGVAVAVAEGRRGGGEEEVRWGWGSGGGGVSLSFVQ